MKVSFLHTLFLFFVSVTTVGLIVRCGSSDNSVIRDLVQIDAAGQEGVETGIGADADVSGELEIHQPECAEDEECYYLLGEPNECVSIFCDKEKGKCVKELLDGQACDDGNVCTQGETCSNGECQGGEWIEECCINATDCDDGNPCTVEVCEQNKCKFDPAEDGKSCVTEQGCDGVCQGGMCNSSDSDGDGKEDCVDEDDDNDGVADGVDNCHFVQNSNQSDIDGDGLGDACDPDKDGDGDVNEEDCAPEDGTVGHYSIELCDGFDNNCNGLVDEAWPELGQDCDILAPQGWVLVGVYVCSEDGTGTECVLADENDGDLDGIPNEYDNCPGIANPGQEDLDGDGVGDVCDDDIDGDGVLNDEDCAAEDPAIFQQNMEICDSIDNDCDGETDEEVDAQNGECPETYEKYFIDMDGDGFGGTDFKCLCEPDVQGKYVAIDSKDCDDGNPFISPVGVESCNNIDDDCDGEVDEEAEPVEGDCPYTYSKYYRDADGDGFAGPDDFACLCAPDAEGVYVFTKATDCDDTDASIIEAEDGSCDGDGDGLVDVTAGGSDCQDTDPNLGLTEHNVDPAQEFVYNGTAYLEDGTIYLLSGEQDEISSVLYHTKLEVGNIEIRFKLKFTSDSVADGITVAFVIADWPEGALGKKGGSLGLAGLPGYGVEFDIFDNGGADPNGNHVGLNLSTKGLMYALATNDDIPELVDGQWHDVKVVVTENGEFRLWYDGELWLDFEAPGNFPFLAYVGFTGASGGSTATAMIKDVVLSCSSE